MNVVLGVDIGGTNTKFGLVTDDGQIVESGNLKTGKYEDAGQLVSELKKQIDRIISFSHGKLKMTSIGVGAPNGNFYSGNIEHAPNLKWKGIVPLRSLFEEKFGMRTIVSNDANAAALGEMRYGAAKGMNDFLVVTLGTGLGSGFVANGQLIYGHDGFAGELGHIIYEHGGRLCGCGRRGCLETYVSAGGIVKTLHELADSGDFRTGINLKEPMNAYQISEAALRGDELAIKAFEKTAEILAHKLADAAAFSSPEAIILFGGLARAGDLLLLPLKSFFEDSLLNIYKGKIKILLSQLKESDAAILGAASLTFSNELE